MIFLNSIRLQNFKGINELECTFDDLTVLAGLNNAGKTSVLEAIHLLVRSIPQIVTHSHMLHREPANRGVNLQPAIASLGYPGQHWLAPFNDVNAGFQVVGTFENGVTVAIARRHGQNYHFEVSSLGDEATNDIQSRAQALNSMSSEMILPPGIVASQEDMIAGPQYDNLISQGKAAQHWRNSLWWAIQDGGIERFEAVRTLVNKYFPDVEVEVPVLGRTSSPPPILMKFRERGRDGTESLDIAQSGSGLRTFLTLARLLEQSDAKIILLDEPDSHLHASQQGVIIRLLLDTAASSSRQILIATHSPEILTRVPSECIRWIERVPAESYGSDLLNADVPTFLRLLGVSPDTYISQLDFPDVIVYVEGKSDRPFIESLIRWCRKRSKELPSTLVVAHKDGRFDAVAVQSLARLARKFNGNARVVGIRDLDWYYGEAPAEEPESRDGPGWQLLTVPCKEFENLLCVESVLYEACEGKVPQDELAAMLDEESNDQTLIDEWRYNLQPRIRDRMENRLDANTKERKAIETFDSWAADPQVRRRLVAGKSLLGKLRDRIRREHSISCYPTRVLDLTSELTPAMSKIATAIFPETERSW